MDVFKPTSTCIGHHDHYLLNPSGDAYLDVSVTNEGKLMVSRYYHPRSPNPSFWTYVGRYQEFPPELF